MEPHPFPTVYKIRAELIDKKKNQLTLEYAKKRQEILLSAKKYCQEIIYLNKRIEVEQQRILQARKVFDQVQELFDRDQIGILVLNKAKISWMQNQFIVDRLQNEKDILLLLLQHMNGDVEVNINALDYPGNIHLLASMDSLWTEKLSVDPTFQIMRNQEEIAVQQIELSKSKSLPNLTAGINYQGVKGSHYSGLFAGLSIPIFSKRYKTEAAETNLDYRQTYSSAQILTAAAEFENTYSEYLLLLSKFEEYQSTLNALSSESLLLEAYELGEISFMEYYLELQFYRKAYDSMLEMEKFLNQLKSEIYQHQL